MLKSFKFKLSEEKYAERGQIVDGKEMHDATLVDGIYYITWYGYDITRVYTIDMVENSIKKGTWIVVD